MGDKMTTKEQLLREIKETEDRLKTLKSSLKKTKELTKYEQAAIILHEQLCHWNHTDGCSWHYAVKQGNHDWTEFAHDKYLKMALALMADGNKPIRFTLEEIEYLAKVFKEYR